MSKELDPSLFGEGAWANPRAMERPARTLESSEHIKDLEKKFVELRAAYREMRETLGRWSSQMEEIQSQWNLRFEKLSHQVGQLEMIQGRVAEDVTKKVSNLHLKIGERGSYDKKIQEMIDRHHAVLRASEARLQHMQKQLAEKDAQILQAQINLNEAKTEIAKLKKF